jgi:hypothetical protein
MKKKKAKKKEVKKKSKSKLQWPTWTKGPFQPGSNLHTFTQAMMKRGGLTVSSFLKLVKKEGPKVTWILKCIRKGSAGGWSWDFDDSHDRYCITNVRLNGKKV